MYYDEKAGFYIKCLQKHFRGTRKYTAVPLSPAQILIWNCELDSKAHTSGIARASVKRPRCDSCGKNESSIASVWALYGVLYGGGGGFRARETGTDKPSDRSFHQREQTLRSRRRHSRPNMSIELIRTCASTHMRAQSRELAKFIRVCICVYVYDERTYRCLLYTS